MHQGESKGIEVSGNAIDISENGGTGGTRLLRYSEKLYYVYNKDTITMKIVEISADGVKTIYTEPSSPFSVEGMVGAPAIQLYEDQLIAVEDDRIIQYDSQTGIWETNERLSSIPYLFGEYYCLNGDIVYHYSEEDPDDEFTYRNFVGCYSDGSLRSYDNDVEYYPDAESTDSVEYYPQRQFGGTDGESLYYTQWILHPDEQQQTELRRYHTTDRTEDILFRSETYSAADWTEYVVLCASEDYVVFEKIRYWDEENPYEIYSMATTPQGKTPKRIYASDEDVAISEIYNDCVYLATTQGVIRYNLETDEQTVLSDRYAEKCYILDDTWVYFISNNASLWRVAQDGSVVEHVYG